MSKLSKTEIQGLFFTAPNFDLLFDTFLSAIKNKIDDPELYRALLANPVLSKDEIAFFSEACSKEFPHMAYDIYLWTGNVIEQSDSNLSNAEVAVGYYAKAINAKPEKFEPFVNLLNLFNYEYNLGFNKTIENTVNVGLKKVAEKKPVYLKLAAHFKQLGDEQKSSYCIKMANNCKIK